MLVWDRGRSGAFRLWEGDWHDDAACFDGEPGGRWWPLPVLVLVELADLMRVNPRLEVAVSSLPLVLPSRRPACGLWVPARARVLVSTAYGDDPRKTLAHELWHSVWSRAEDEDGADELSAWAARVAPKEPPGEREAIAFELWSAAYGALPAGLEPPEAAAALMAAALAGRFAL